MAILPAGSYALVKLDNHDHGERFMILLVDPDKVDRPGYTWSSSGPMTEPQASQALAEMGVGAIQQAGLFDAARRHWSAQHHDEAIL